MKSLENKRVLLCAPNFFGYELEIRKALQARGAEVDCIPDRPFTSPFLKAVTRYRRNWILGYADRQYEKALSGFGRQHYDLILVVQGEALSPRFLRSLRSSYPSARFVLYMWDSFRNKRQLLGNLERFDHSLSFDPLDAKQYGMTFRPLFYCPDFVDATAFTGEYEYDVSFIGTAHSDRYSLVRQLSAALPKGSSTYWYLFLQSTWMFHIQKLGNPSFAGSTATDFAYVPLAKAEVQRVFKASRSVLDIEHPAQTGLTMRTFEALAAGKKLITTNRNILEYDFFDPQNILYIDRSQTPDIPASFSQTPYRPVSPALMDKYSLDGWLNDVLN
ncbi:glycosyltransferase family protein [Roseateles violae]|uniref:Spore protein YkvP/CgeB glycosyl transferase-like domain-containing protein n=1 Tax=Roseateles violae TaxID=3058042 RepID=A0ABT8DWX6_9BURK|nr:hypothetical protein [Pelomonas sp. PFR6]MDN3920954.1 hypothetical protein [Pelomonas sp. PFR6]